MSMLSGILGLKNKREHVARIPTGLDLYHDCGSVPVLGRVKDGVAFIDGRDVDHDGDAGNEAFPPEMADLARRCLSPRHAVDRVAPTAFAEVDCARLSYHRANPIAATITTVMNAKMANPAAISFRSRSMSAPSNG